ncbi:MAG: transposase, partial [Deltaproteobacteria bacterium]|nr:transposase [Deltaproteobacteria bacterium]
LVALKRQVPERSLDRLVRVAEDLGLVQKGKARRSTVHRLLAAERLSARRARPQRTEDLDSYEADFPNETWQSDMLQGPWLPDPRRPGRVRRTWLYAFLDDHSRLCLHGRFSFKGDLPARELVFRRALQKHGLPRRVYYDNGATYRSAHMRHIVASLGMEAIVFTRVRRPMGHGKIEAFNRLVTSAFVAEVSASRIHTLDALNEAWLAWVDHAYNGEVHGETGQRPRDRWRAGLANIRFVDEGKLRQAFLWRETRTPDKAGVFSLFGTEYQVGPALARKAIEVRYDPEHLGEIEVWHKGTLVERLRSFVVGRHRRPGATHKPPEPPRPSVDSDWLGHLVARRRAESFVEPTPAMLREEAERRRADADAAVIELFAARLDLSVLDVAAVQAFLGRHGPWDPELAAAALDVVLASHPPDLHVRVYLDLLRTQLKEKSRP